VLSGLHALQQGGQAYIGKQKMQAGCSGAATHCVTRARLGCCVHTPSSLSTCWCSGRRVMVVTSRMLQQRSNTILLSGETYALDLCIGQPHTAHHTSPTTLSRYRRGALQAVVAVDNDPHTWLLPQHHALRSVIATRLLKLCGTSSFQTGGMLLQKDIVLLPQPDSQPLTTQP
jgi:hypothetical protein